MPEASYAGSRHGSGTREPSTQRQRQRAAISGCVEWTSWRRTSSAFFALSIVPSSARGRLGSSTSIISSSRAMSYSRLFHGRPARRGASPMRLLSRTACAQTLGQQLASAARGPSSPSTLRRRL